MENKNARAFSTGFLRIRAKACIQKLFKYYWIPCRASLARNGKILIATQSYIYQHSGKMYNKRLAGYA